MTAWDDMGSAVLEFFNDDPLTVTYIQNTQGTYDPATSTYSPTTIETPCKAILLDLTKTNNGLSVKFGTEIVAGDKELYLLPPEKDFFSAPLTITTGADKILIWNTLYTVVNMKEINPQGNAPLVYNFMIRR